LPALAVGAAIVGFALPGATRGGPQAWAAAIGGPLLATIPVFAIALCLCGLLALCAAARAVSEPQSAAAVLLGLVAERANGLSSVVVGVAALVVVAQFPVPQAVSIPAALVVLNAPALCASFSRILVRAGARHGAAAAAVGASAAFSIVAVFVPAAAADLWAELLERGALMVGQTAVIATIAPVRYPLSVALWRSAADAGAAGRNGLLAAAIVALALGLRLLSARLRSASSTAGGGLKMVGTGA